jgi:hypothetical protein
LGKRGSIKESTILGDILRRKIIETMLYMIRTYPFCCLSHQQAIMILNSLKEAFDQDDVATLKNFVKKELSCDSSFSYPSGFKTAGLNMGQITQIAFELRDITQQALDDMSSDEEEEKDDEVSVAKRKEMGDWFKFCKDKVTKIEKVWKRKLEDPTGDDSSEEHAEEEDPANGQQEKDQYEQQLQAMFENFGKRQNASSQQQSRPDAELLKTVGSVRPGAKDDMDVKPVFADNQFWNKPELHDDDDLAALMAEVESGN